MRPVVIVIVLPFARLVIEQVDIVAGAAWPRDESDRLCAGRIRQEIGGQRSLSRASVRQAQTQCAR
jgi:hypothetical protein